MRIIIYIILFYLLYRFLGRIFAFNKNSRGIRREEVIDDMVQDPYCKAYIPQTGAYTRIVNGKKYYFCSKECADKFEESESK